MFVCLSYFYSQNIVIERLKKVKEKSRMERQLEPLPFLNILLTYMLLIIKPLGNLYGNKNTLISLKFI